MNQKAKDYIRRNTLDLESDNRMDSTGYVQYAISEAKADRLNEFIKKLDS